MSHTEQTGAPPKSAPTRAGLRIATLLEEFFWPAACLSCGSGKSRILDGGICAACWAALPRPPEPRCDRCDLPLQATGASGLTAPRCGRCLADPPEFDRLRTATLYEGSGEAILKAFKYKGAEFLAPRLANLLAEQVDLDPTPAAVVPVPATRGELRGRGFHPAGALARCLAKVLD